MDVSYDLLLISVCTRGVETFEPPLYLAQKVPADRIRRGAFVCQTTSFSLSPFASWQIEERLQSHRRVQYYDRVRSKHVMKTS